MDGAVTAESSYNDVELARVAGSVDVRTVHGGLQAADLLKGGRVAALGGDVSIQRFAGALEVQAERAAVDLLPAGALKEPLLARTTFGDIRLHVPAGSRMQLEASASNGEVGFDVPGLAVTRDAGGRATGTLAGGTNAVRLATDHGNVEIASAPAASAVAEDDDRGGGGEKRAARKRD
jgi:hypothetical protein